MQVNANKIIRSPGRKRKRKERREDSRKRKEKEGKDKRVDGIDEEEMSKHEEV